MAKDLSIEGALEATKKAKEDVAANAAERLAKIQTDYAGDEDRPLAGYLRAMSIYTALATSAVVIGRITGKKFPDRISPGDFALMAVATHKIARIVAKDAITSPLRAPFTKYEEPTGASELNESVRASGWKHAVGELIECPFCLAVWIASTFTAGFTFAPRLTRWVGVTFSAVFVSDTLQFGYDRLKKSAS